MQQREGIQMASAADPMLQKEYDKYVFEMQEQGLEPMSLEDFRQQAVAGMATGGRAGYKDGYSVQGGVKNYLGDQETVSDVPIKWQSGPDKPATELAYITKAEKDLLLKKDIHGSLKDGPNVGPGGLMSLDSWGDAGDFDRPSSKSSSPTHHGGGGADAKKYKAPAPKTSSPPPGSPDYNRTARTITPELPPHLKKLAAEGKPTSIQTKEQEKQAAKQVKAFLKSKEPEKKTILQKANALMGPEAWYAWAQGIPGAKTNLLRQRKRYKDYLEKYYGPDYNLDWFDEEDIEDYDLYKRLVGMERPIAESGMSPGMTYAEFLASGAASKQGIPNFTLLSRGDLGNLSSLKKPDNIIDPNLGKERKINNSSTSCSNYNTSNNTSNYNSNSFS